MSHPFGNHFVGYAPQQQFTQEEIDLAIGQMLRSRQQPLAFPPLPPPISPEYAFYQQQLQQLRNQNGEDGDDEEEEDDENEEDEVNEEDGNGGSNNLNGLNGYAQGYGHSYVQDRGDGYDDGLFHSPKYPAPIVIADTYSQSEQSGQEQDEQGEDAYDDEDSDPQGCDDWDPGAGGEGGCSV